MAQLKTSRLDNSTAVENIDDRVKDLEQDLAAILGILIDTVIANPAFAIDATGLISLLLQSTADPSVAGELSRVGAELRFHNGSDVVSLALANHPVFQASSNGFGTRRWQTTVPADGDYSEGDITYVY